MLHNPYYPLRVFKKRRVGRKSKKSWTENDLKVIEHFLPYGTDPNVYNRWGMAPLHLACEEGAVYAVENLIQQGADVNMSTLAVLGHSPPLLFAAGNGRTECVCLLLEAGAMVNASDFWGNTALLKAACYNHVECVKILIAYGADPNQANRWSATPLQYAALQGNHEVVDLLIRAGCDLAALGEPRKPPSLVGAAMRGHYRSLELLMLAGADIEQYFGEAEETVLVHAISCYQRACTEIPGALDLFSGNSVTSTLADRLSCIWTLLKHGAAVKVKCLEQLYSFYYFGVSSVMIQDYHLLLLELVIRALCYLGKHKPAIDELFQQVAFHCPKQWNTLRLLCSIGYTPTTDIIEVVQIHLETEQFHKLVAFNQSPRSLQDICRMVVRQACQKNVLCAAENLPLPPSLKDYLTLRTSVTYSL